MEPSPPLHNSELHEFVFNLLKKFPPRKLLDIPSGPGYFARKAQAHSFESIAGEIDATLHVFPDVHYQRADMAKDFPFDDETFDYIVSIEGIEHTENQFHFLRECFRVLRKGGRLFLTTPNTSSLEDRWIFFLTGKHDPPLVPIRDDLPNIFFEHINLIPFYRLETFLRHSGFQLEFVTTERFRKGALLLYPFVFPILWLKLRLAFRQYFKGKPDEEKYWQIFKLYRSKVVLCGSSMIIVAVKPR